MGASRCSARPRGVAQLTARKKSRSDLAQRGASRARRTVSAAWKRALSGTLHAFACEAVTQGTRFNLHLETALVGRDFEQGTPLDRDRSGASRLRSATAGRGRRLPEISTSISDFGRLLSLKTPRSPAQVPTDPTARCFTMIHGKHEPCADCPVLEQSGSGWPRTTAHRGSHPRRDRLRGRHGPKAYGDRIRVRLRRIAERALGAIHESKVRALADSAQLSDRERARPYLLAWGARSPASR